jgi:PAS domain S-box-containing protein
MRNASPEGAAPINPASTVCSSDTRSAAALPAHPMREIEPEFSGLARLAATACATPLASIELNGYGETWCSSTGALPKPILPARNPFCRSTCEAKGLFQVSDTTADGRFRDMEGVSGAPGLRFYAGVALRTRGGEVLGTLAVYDTRLRDLTEQQRLALELLAQQAVTQVDLHTRIAGLELLAAAPAPSSADVPLAKALIESASVVIYHSNMSGNLTYVNPEYRRIFGLTPEQSTNDWVHGVHPDDRQRIEDAWEDFCRNPRPVRFDYRTKPVDGAVRYFTEQVVPAQGVAGFVGTISDFTDLITTRGELRKAETLFQNTFDQAPIGIVFTDRGGKFLRFNAAFSALLGFDANELAGKSIAEVTHGEDVMRTTAELERLWAGEIDSFDHERRYTRRDGTVMWVRATMALVRDGNSRPDYSVGFLRDITMRKEMSAALLQQQTLLEAVITDLPIALLACDMAGNITHYNRAAMELHGVDAESHPMTALVFLADGVTPVSAGDHPLMRALRGETISNLELVIQPREAMARSTLSSARRLIGPNGQTLGAVAVVQDTTERKRAELELERVHKELMTASRQAGMAEVATNVLHNVGNILNSVNISASLVTDRVKQSKAPGVTLVADLLKDQGADLAAFMSTDARGKRIPEYLSALGQQLTADQQMSLQELGSLRDNLEHIKETVTMQQSYAKLCGVTETVEVVDLVEDSLRLNAGAFARHGVTLLREFSPVPPITVDKHKVLQILVNLVRNAKYACDESGKTEKLIILRIAPATKGVCISVIDNGVGIPAENMDRLFTHGFTTRQSGHGFGLHSGALAAQELGGTLLATSDGAGRGAAFILELPCVRREDSPHA